MSKSNVHRRYLKFSYHRADIPYYRLCGSPDVSYYRYDLIHYDPGIKDAYGKTSRVICRMWVTPTPASLARLARLPYTLTVESSWCFDRWYMNGVADYVTFDFRVQGV